MPVLVRLPTFAPAPIRTPVAASVPLPATTAWIVPVLTRAGAETPAPTWMAVALASTAEAAIEPSLRTPPAIVTACPPSTPS